MNKDSKYTYRAFVRISLHREHQFLPPYMVPSSYMCRLSLLIYNFIYFKSGAITRNNSYVPAEPKWGDRYFSLLRGAKYLFYGSY